MAELYMNLLFQSRSRLDLMVRGPFTFMYNYVCALQRLMFHLTLDYKYHYLQTIVANVRQYLTSNLMKNKVASATEPLLNQFVLPISLDKLIGVHCTHGLNRTGYLVCRYLIDVEGMEPNMAIELFNRCRGHSIERKNYIEALRGGSGRRNHHMAASGRGWMNGYYGPVANPGFQATTYSQRHLQQFPLETPRHFPPRRGRGGQNPQRKPYHTSHRNLINCYDSGQPVYHPQYLPTADITQQGLDYPVRSSQGLHYSSYHQQLQGHAGPHFPVQSPHYPQQQGRYKIDRRHH
nr:RNA/RNP complex-1-interacting phosphatase isoform X2 [Zootoca vivipara]